MIAAATIYIVMRSLGAKNKRTSDGPMFGRAAYRMPLTEVVRANLPVHARVALIQQQRVRPSDREESSRHWEGRLSTPYGARGGFGVGGCRRVGLVA